MKPTRESSALGRRSTFATRRPVDFQLPVRKVEARAGMLDFPGRASCKALKQNIAQDTLRRDYQFDFNGYNLGSCYCLASRRVRNTYFDARYADDIASKCAARR